MALVTKEKAFCSALPFEDVPVDEWEGEARIKTLCASERLAWETVAYPGGKVDDVQFFSGLVARCLIDESGVRLISDKEIPAFDANAAGHVVNKLWHVAARLNGIGQAADDVRKNSNASR